MRFVLLLLCGLGLGSAQEAIGIFDGQGGVGDTPKPGAAGFSNGEYTLTGGGANIWATQDAFHFVWKKMSGDVRLTADVQFVGQGAIDHRKVVLMIRQDLTAGSAYADVALHGDGLTSLQFRPAASAPTQEIKSTATAPTRLRIERRGNRFTIATMKPGEDWISAGPQAVDLADPVYVGIGICSHDANVLETAIVSNVQLEALPRAPRYRSTVTIYDTVSKVTREVYTHDDVMEAPNWSRDGRFLLVNTGGKLYRLPIDGPAKLDPIEVGPGLRCNNDHDLSKDGQYLAFSASSPTSKGSQVYLAKADGSDAKLMTPAVPSYFHGWSPDGKWLAFVGQRDKKFELFRVAATGGEEQRLTSNGGYDDGPEYTPDNKWIYFNSNRSGGWDIWRMPIDGAGPNDSKAEQVTNDALEDWFPHFSPNGKWMLFLSFPHGTTGHNDRLPGVILRMAPAPGKKLKPIVAKQVVSIFGGQGTINVNSWSPDSKRFAYVVFSPIPQ